VPLLFFFVPVLVVVRRATRVIEGGRAQVDYLELCVALRAFHEVPDFDGIT
jgi:hypothetical protein